MSEITKAGVVITVGNQTAKAIPGDPYGSLPFGRGDAVEFDWEVFGCANTLYGIVSGCAGEGDGGFPPGNFIGPVLAYWIDTESDGRKFVPREKVRADSRKQDEPKQLEFNPDWASPPGDTVRDWMDTEGFDVDAVAKRFGWPVRSVDELLSGEMRISESIAITLSRHVGSTSQFWLKREQQYRNQLARIQAEQAAAPGDPPFVELSPGITDWPCKACGEQTRRRVQVVGGKIERWCGCDVVPPGARK